MCLCTSHTHSVSRLCKPSKHLGSMLWIWLLWRCLEKKKYFIFFWTNQILAPQVISKQAAVSKSHIHFFKKMQTQQSKTSLTGQRGQRGW